MSILVGMAPLKTAHLIRVLVLFCVVLVTVSGCVRIWNLVYISLEANPDATILVEAIPQIEDSFLVRKIPVKYIIEREHFDLVFKVPSGVIPALEIEAIPKHPGQQLAITTEDYFPKYYHQNVICYGRISNAKSPKSSLTFQWSVFQACRVNKTAPELVLRIDISENSLIISREALPFSIRKYGFVKLVDSL